MRSNALYFPFIDIPHSNWMIRTLLYWDRVSSIVPLEYVVKPDNHSDFMRGMLEAELVEQVFPSHYLWQVPGFEETFIQYLEAKLPMLRNERPDPRNLSKVHVEKMGHLPDWLLRNNLAKRDGYSWLIMSDSIAGPFMAYLANVLGSIEEVNAAPLTDNKYLSSYYKIYENNHRNRSEPRDYILEQLLPYPDENISLDSLLRFKQDHGHLLPRLREKIERYSSELCLIQDKELRKARADNIVSDCREDIREIHENMSLSWDKIAYGSIFPLVGTGGALYTMDPAQNAIATAAAGFAFLAASYQAIANIPIEQTAEYKPLAYLAFAEEKLLKV